MILITTYFAQYVKKVILFSQCIEAYCDKSDMQSYVTFINYISSIINLFIIYNDEIYIRGVSIHH